MWGYFWVKLTFESVCSQPCPTLCSPMDCSPRGSSAHGIFQARTLEWAATFYSRGSSRPNLLHWQAGSLPLAPPGMPLWVSGLSKSHCLLQCEGAASNKLEAWIEQKNREIDVCLSTLIWKIIHYMMQVYKSMYNVIICVKKDEKNIYLYLLILKSLKILKHFKMHKSLIIVNFRDM